MARQTALGKVIQEYQDDLAQHERAIVDIQKTIARLKASQAKPKEKKHRAPRPVVDSAMSPRKDERAS